MSSTSSSSEFLRLLGENWPFASQYGVKRYAWNTDGIRIWPARSSWNFRTCSSQVPGDQGSQGFVSLAKRHAHVSHSTLVGVKKGFQEERRRTSVSFNWLLIEIPFSGPCFYPSSSSLKSGEKDVIATLISSLLLMPWICLILRTGTRVFPRESLETWVPAHPRLTFFLLLIHHFDPHQMQNYTEHVHWTEETNLIAESYPMSGGWFRLPTPACERESSELIPLLILS